MAERYHAVGLTGGARRAMKPRDKLDSAAIDALYGLEPVFEPGDPGAGTSTDLVTVQCPYCGEAFDTAVDVSSGSFSYVEDCQVCCQPIQMDGDVDDAGRLVGFSADREG
jgi:hypothetical protein